MKSFTEKRCTRCKRVQLEIEFWFKNKAHGRHDSQCRTCRSKRAKTPQSPPPPEGVAPDPQGPRLHQAGRAAPRPPENQSAGARQGCVEIRQDHPPTLLLAAVQCLPVKGKTPQSGDAPSLV